ncbi:hypothetical protein AArcSl_0355 [Halalkaliarchaeum desulfuricum]|uniref:DUF790 family protein n=1 Tax=Halalkaliarchaeum desulfuricum TaxID=2055893 RepID=A0A343TFY6_9EURY|nr:DUF790 family protein [Halalkaliarchaeum desulfuricum]AUX08008.1 hypothetical protein AArcSl_0355 [Halalkaliarchaeum desulfuricum]
MLRKELLRVSRAGGGYHPQFVGREERPLAARAIGTYQGHVGERRERLDAAIEELERESDDFKLVRGFASLLDREAVFETRAPIPPERARRVAFERAEAVGVATEQERSRARSDAAERLGVDPDDIEQSLYADREPNQYLASFESPWSPDELLDRYNLSLAQTALFDATEVRIESSDPRRLVSAVKRLGLLYELRNTEVGRTLFVTGPDALFGRTRRYGTAFARLLASVASAEEWSLRATIDDRGTERELKLETGDVVPPTGEPIAEPTYDSGVEADFAARFEALDRPWQLRREPEPLSVNTSVMIPDFAFDYEHADFRVFFEVMGFWTPSYVEKKLDQLANVEDVQLLVAVDETLGLDPESSTERRTETGEAAAEVKARDHRVVTYSGSVRVKDVVDVLREYESGFIEREAERVPEEVVPDADVISLVEVAAEFGVSVAAVEEKAFPEHRVVGRTLVRPAVLSEIDENLEPGQSLADVESILESRGLSDASAVLSTLGYRIEWEGLGGGRLRRRKK